MQNALCPKKTNNIFKVKLNADFLIWSSSEMVIQFNNREFYQTFMVQAPGVAGVGS